jgi:hypothetical protein
MKGPATDSPVTRWPSREMSCATPVPGVLMATVPVAAVQRHGRSSTPSDPAIADPPAEMPATCSATGYSSAMPRERKTWFSMWMDAWRPMWWATVPTTLLGGFIGYRQGGGWGLVIGLNIGVCVASQIVRWRYPPPPLPGTVPPRERLRAALSPLRRDEKWVIGLAPVAVGLAVFVGMGADPVGAFAGAAAGLFCGAWAVVLLRLLACYQPPRGL